CRGPPASWKLAATSCECLLRLLLPEGAVALVARGVQAGAGLEDGIGVLAAGGVGQLDAGVARGERQLAPLPGVLLWRVEVRHLAVDRDPVGEQDQLVRLLLGAGVGHLLLPQGAELLLDAVERSL